MGVSMRKRSAAILFNAVLSKTTLFYLLLWVCIFKSYYGKYLQRNLHFELDVLMSILSCMVGQPHQKRDRYLLWETLSKFELIFLDNFCCLFKIQLIYLWVLKEKKQSKFDIHRSFNRSRINEPTPEPVPPAIEWQSTKPFFEGKNRNDKKHYQVKNI